MRAAMTLFFVAGCLDSSAFHDRLDALDPPGSNPATSTPTCPDGSAAVLGFADLDGDGHGDPDAPIQRCPGEPGVADGSDCDDADPTQPAVGYVDGDGDGFGAGDLDLRCGGAIAGGDCDDADPSIHPTAIDYSSDGIDSDCDQLDCGVVTVASSDEIAERLTLACPGDTIQLENGVSFVQQVDLTGVVGVTLTAEDPTLPLPRLVAPGSGARALVLDDDFVHDIEITGSNPSIDGGCAIVRAGVGASPRIENVLFDACSSSRGALAVDFGVHELVVRDSQFYECSGSVGAAIYDDGSVLSRFEGLEITRNVASTAVGGIHARDPSWLTIASSTFDNVIEAAIDIDDGIESLIEDCTFLAPDTNDSGGAIQLQRGSATVRSSTFTGATTHGTGGAIAAFYMSRMEIEDSVFDGCVSPAGGGAVHWLSYVGSTNDLTYTNLTFLDSDAPVGAAMYLEHAGEVVLDGFTVVDSGVTQLDSAAIHVRGVDQTTVTGMVASGNDDVMRLDGGRHDVLNLLAHDNLGQVLDLIVSDPGSIVSQMTMARNGGGVSLVGPDVAVTNFISSNNAWSFADPDEDGISYEYGLFDGDSAPPEGVAGQGLQIEVDPLFTSTSDFTLANGSPAIDAGTGLDRDGSLADLGTYGGPGAP